MPLLLTSSAFFHGEEIPQRYTCEGSDLSPPLTWSGAPEATKSLILLVDDPDAPDPQAPKMTWVHWVLYNLPRDAVGLPEGVAAEAARGHRAGPERLEKDRLRRPVPADRATPLLS